ncbi:hypothetical protein BJ170DRAFT_683896 [Xylariales sp. AK1849]|nr:hypothetical protein BJ170DRAFT_683896 [Xylariales sp. AK1849]
MATSSERGDSIQSVATGNASQTGEKRKAEAISSDAMNETTTIDPSGDLRLRVGGEVADNEVATEFLVDSRALARHSKVFKAMLFGKFKNSSSTREPDKEWVYELPADKPDALKYVLHITHANLALVKNDLRLVDIFDVVDLTHKYDLTELLRGRAGPWAKSTLRSPSLNDASEMRQAVIIAWELGYESMFTKLLNEIASHCSLGFGDDMKLGKGLATTSMYFHVVPDFDDRIRAARAAVLKQKLSVPDKLVQQLQGYIVAEPYRSCANDHQGHGGAADCEAAALGSLMRSLVAQELWPLPWEFRGSLVDLDAKLKSIVVIGASDFVKFRKQNCNWTSNIQGWLSVVRSPCVQVDDGTKAHLAAQAKKTGLERYTYTLTSPPLQIQLASSNSFLLGSSGLSRSGVMLTAQSPGSGLFAGTT